jgi:phytoene synthase
MVNASPESALSAPELLAIAYAPRLIREEFRWLLAFDRRLRDVLARAREPMIAQLRLAWWRDALQKPVHERPQGEPLLAQLTSHRAALATLAAAMVDGYEAMIDGTGPGKMLPLFVAYHGLVGGTAEELDAIEKLAGGAEPKSPRKYRPLSILALAAQMEKHGGRANGLRLSWHALTGR